jgi:hypothetical protein
MPEGIGYLPATGVYGGSRKQAMTKKQAKRKKYSRNTYGYLQYKDDMKKAGRAPMKREDFMLSDLAG